MRSHFLTRTLDPIFLNAKKKAATLPHFGVARIADTHAHLDMLADPAMALARSAIAGLGLVITLVNVDEEPTNTAENLSSWLAEAQHMLDNYAEKSGTPRLLAPEVCIIVGTHPHDASTYTATTESRIRALAKDKRVVGLGEIGLDFHYDNSPRDVQMRVFIEQLALAAELNLTACLHLREAHTQALEVLEQEKLPEAGWILHCYNLGPETLKPFLELEPYVSFAGPLTFKKADDVRKSAAIVPLEALLTETDCPFMAPEPARGRSNEPGYVAFVAQKLAEVRGMTNEELARVTLNNAKRCFGI